jgi:hypothetical protein
MKKKKKKPGKSRWEKFKKEIVGHAGEIALVLATGVITTLMTEVADKYLSSWKKARQQ